MREAKRDFIQGLSEFRKRNAFTVLLVAVTILTVGLAFSQTALPSVRAVPLNNNPDCISWGLNRIDCFDLGSDGVPYHSYWDGPGTDWSSWLSIGGVLASTPSCVTWAVDRIDCVGVASNGVAYHVSWDGNAWSSWASLVGPAPPQFTSTPSCVPIAIYQQNFACVGLDTQSALPLPRVWDATGQSWYWTETSGDLGSITFTSGPNCMSWGQPGRFDCFLLDSRGRPYHLWFENNVDSRDIEDMGGFPLLFAPTCVSLGSGGFDCVGVGKDGGTYHNHWNGQVWGGWGLMAQGQLRYAPSCTTWGTNRIDCVGIGTDDQAYHIWSADGYGSTWSSWDLVAPGPLLYTPSCVAWAANRIDCVGVGTDDLAYHLSWDGSSWSSWDPIGGPGVATTFTYINKSIPIQSSTTFLTGKQITQTLTTNVAASGTGSVSPDCPSGCSQTVGTPTFVAASPAANFQFSGWSVSGASCLGGSGSNPCGFTMPNNAVTVTANFSPVSGASPISADWAVLSVGWNPPNPQAGTSVVFKMTMTLMSTAGSLPQTVDVTCQLDGVSCGAGSVTYPGPQGQALDVMASAPWAATPGTHTLTWSISITNDPNPANNMMSTTFTVQPAGASQSLTSATMSQSSTSNMQVTLMQVQTVTQQPTSASSQTASQPGVLDILLQNSLLVIGLVLLVVLLAVIDLRRRGGKQTSPSSIGSKPVAASLFCGQCGASNPSTSQYCRKCGEKLAA